MVPTVFENYHPGASVKKADGKERTSPAKDEFLERGDFKKSGYPEDIAMDRLYYPFQTKKVDFSDFWSFPMTSFLCESVCELQDGLCMAGGAVHLRRDEGMGSGQRGSFFFPI